MSANCVSCQDALSCSDSPLSITSNVISILTFVGALVVTIHLYIISFKHSRQNIADMHRGMANRHMKAGGLHAKMNVKLGPTIENEKIGEAVQNRLRYAIERKDQAFQKTQPYFTSIMGLQDKKKFWMVSAKYVMQENALKEDMRKIDESLQQLDEALAEAIWELEETDAAADRDFRENILQQQTDLQRNLESTTSQLMDELRALRQQLDEKSPPKTEP